MLRCVLWEEPRRRLAHCLPLDHPKAVYFSSTLILAGGPLTCHPLVVEELTEDGQGFGAAWSAHSNSPHRGRHGRNFSFAER